MEKATGIVFLCLWFVLLLVLLKVLSFFLGSCCFFFVVFTLFLVLFCSCLRTPNLKPEAEHVLGLSHSTVWRGFNRITFWIGGSLVILHTFFSLSQIYTQVPEE